MINGPILQFRDFVAGPNQEPVNLSLPPGRLEILTLSREKRRAFVRAVVTAKHHRGQMLLPPADWTPGSDPPDRLLPRHSPPRNRVAGWLKAPTFPTLTPAESVLLAARTGGIRLYDPERLLTPLGLENLDDTPAGRLNELERVRLGLATALASEPVLILADDPLGDFDGGTKQRILDLLPALLGSSCCVYLCGSSG
jgi:hypothetical protein